MDFGVLKTLYKSTIYIFRTKASFLAPFEIYTLYPSCKSLPQPTFLKFNRFSDGAHHPDFSEVPFYYNWHYQHAPIYKHCSKDISNASVCSLNSPLSVSTETLRSQVTCPWSHSSQRTRDLNSEIPALQLASATGSLYTCFFFPCSLPFLNVFHPLSQHTVIS